MISPKPHSSPHKKYWTMPAVPQKIFTHRPETIDISTYTYIVIRMNRNITMLNKKEEILKLITDKLATGNYFERKNLRQLLQTWRSIGYKSDPETLIWLKYRVEEC